MSLSTEGLGDALRETVHRLSGAGGDVSQNELAAVPEPVLQEMVRIVMAVNFAKIEAGQPVPLIPRPDAISATAVMAGVSALLKGANLEIFELGMWQAWNGRH